MPTAGGPNPWRWRGTSNPGWAARACSSVAAADSGQVRRLGDHVGAAGAETVVAHGPVIDLPRVVGRGGGHCRRHGLPVARRPRFGALAGRWIAGLGRVSRPVVGPLEGVVGGA